MKRALHLAEKGRFNVSPNPRVGCVIVSENKIIGEGYHRKYGEAHAEVNAVNSVDDLSQLRNAILYVSLEPCSHTGKTPPCVDLILKHNIPKVVIANKDPFEKVDGSGIAKLKANGIEVIEGVLESEGRELNRRFFTFHEKQRPYIILKWAQTADSFIGRTKESNENSWISNTISKQLVHLYRAEEEAILVGRNTVSVDNPALTCREIDGKNPIRIIFDPSLKLSSSNTVFNEEAPTLVLNQVRSKSENNVEWIQIDPKIKMVDSLINICYERKIQSIIIEGGANTLAHFISSNCWDEARVFTSNKLFKNGVLAPKFKGELKESYSILHDHLSIYSNPNQ